MKRQSNPGLLRVSSGFTIVELLVVIVVIAILATITIVAYNGIQNSAYDSAIKSDLANNGKQLYRYSAENGTLPSSAVVIGARVTKSAYLTSRNNLYFCINATTNRFAIVGISKSGTAFQNVDGTITQSSGQPWGADTCAMIGNGTLGGGFDQSGGTGWQSWVSG